jgi:hypothetical protein
MKIKKEAKPKASRKWTISRHKRSIHARRAPHKKLLLHPTFVLGLLCIGVFMVSWTYKVVADTVSSVIEAPALTSSATITSPSYGETLNSSQVEVSGSCPINSYVKLQLNGNFVGVAWCSDDNSYNITTTLYSGTNVLVAQDYNSTNLAGPTSNPVTVYYQPPAALKTPSQTNKANPQQKTTTTVSGNQTTQTSPGSSSSQAPVVQSSQSKQPILVSSSFEFKTFSVNNQFSWQTDISGGAPPYKVMINWGDGSTSSEYLKTDPLITIKHQYKEPGYYSVVLSVEDSTGSKQTLQLAALINNAKGQSPFITTPTTSSGAGLGNSSNTHNRDWLILAWPGYITVSLMALSFWLGEKRELELIRNRTNYNR